MAMLSVDILATEGVALPYCRLSDQQALYMGTSGQLKKYQYCQARASSLLSQAMMKRCSKAAFWQYEIEWPEDFG